MIADDEPAWRAQIELTTSESEITTVIQQLKRLRKSFTRDKLVAAAAVRLRDIRRQAEGYDPWNQPMIIGNHMLPPLSHRYGK